MKLATVALFAAAGSTPILAAVGVDWIRGSDVQDVLDGGNVTDVAHKIAQREFSPDVRLTLLGQHDSPNVTGDFGDDIHAPDGQVYRHLLVQVATEGRLDVSVHTFHFSARDDARRVHNAELGLNEKFEVTQLKQGDAASGVVVFLVPRDAALESLTWQGELANSTLALRAPAGAASAAPSGEMQPSAPASPQPPPDPTDP